MLKMGIKIVLKLMFLNKIAKSNHCGNNIHKMIIVE